MPASLPTSSARLSADPDSSTGRRSDAGVLGWGAMRAAVEPLTSSANGWAKHHRRADVTGLGRPRPPRIAVAIRRVAPHVSFLAVSAHAEDPAH